MSKKPANNMPNTLSVHTGIISEDEQLDISNVDDVMSDWRLFYRYSEFWLISAAVLVPVVWYMVTFDDDGMWGNVLIQQLIGLVATVTITLLTGAAINRRKTLLDRGIIPWTVRLDIFSRGRLGPLAIVSLIGWALFFRPVWTMPGLIHTLQAGYAVHELVPILSVSVALMAVAMAVVVPTSRSLKIMRALIFLLGFGLTIYANFGIGYGGEDAATASPFDAVLIIGLPLLVALWYIVDCFRSPTELSR